MPTFIIQFAKLEHLPDDDDAVIYSIDGELFANGLRSNPPNVSDGNGWPSWSSESLYRSRGTPSELMIVDEFASALNQIFDAAREP